MVLNVTTPVPDGWLLVMNTMPCGTRIEPENANPVVIVTAVGAADAVVGLPNKDDAVIDDIDIVPTPVIGPPVNPVPVLTCVTVPEPLIPLTTMEVPDIESPDPMVICCRSPLATPVGLPTTKLTPVSPIGLSCWICISRLSSAFSTAIG